jgi:hypothetical protein
VLLDLGYAYALQQGCGSPKPSPNGKAVRETDRVHGMIDRFKRQKRQRHVTEALGRPLKQFDGIRFGLPMI